MTCFFNWADVKRIKRRLEKDITIMSNVIWQKIIKVNKIVYTDVLNQFRQFKKETLKY